MSGEMADNDTNTPDDSQLDQYTLISPGMPADLRIMTQNDKDQLLHALRTRKYRTITELRRVERVLAESDETEVTESLTSAWRHYVNSNNMLSELRGLTPTYPFSSECVDEAKELVMRDAASSRSWNFCWLILTMIQNQNLIQKHARALAAKPSTWGGTIPSNANVERLIGACTEDWDRALTQMLRHWEKPPTSISD